MKEGWIYIHKKILEWEWYDDSNTKSIFLDFVINASYEDKKWKGIDIKRGQLIIGRKELSKRLGISEQSLRTSITRLKSTNEITSKSTNKFTIITVINYDKYQISKTKSTSKLTSYLTNEQPATNQQLTTSNKVINKEISIMQTEIISYWNETLGNKFLPSTDMETNLQYWLKVFSLEEIKTAIGNIPSLLDTSPFWKTMRPKLFFRQKNKLGEADYIEQALNVKSSKEKYIKL